MPKISAARTVHVKNGAVRYLSQGPSAAVTRSVQGVRLIRRKRLTANHFEVSETQLEASAWCMFCVR